MDQSDSITELALKAVESIKSLGDAEKVGQVQRYFKETVKSYGVSAREVRQVAAEIYKDKKNKWKENEILRFCELLLKDPHVEIKSMAGVLMAHFSSELSPGAFFRIRSWLEADLCDNWAAVDTLCPNTMGLLLKKHPELLLKIKEWAFSPNRWVRRASLVSFIKPAKDKNYHPEEEGVVSQRDTSSPGHIKKAGFEFIVFIEFVAFIGFFTSVSKRSFEA
ncbi:MAG: DNA alkylation repair protein [Acidobacteriota bacterium]